MSAAHLPSWESVDFVVVSQLVFDFEVFLEKVLKQLNFYGFPIRRGHCCDLLIWQLEKSVNVAIKVCRIAFACQLLNGQQNLVCLDCGKGVFTVDLRLTRRVGFLLFA